MGDTGPCGPCSEVHYDMGLAASDQGHTDCAFGCDCGRYVELWNLVFMQFDRDVSGKLNPLPKPSIDTGMGLERLAAVLQGKVSNYDTDLFTPLILHAAHILLGNWNLPPSLAEDDKHVLPSLRIIADHSRAATFLISDGVLPANEGRGYVLRKIIRRAITHGRLLGRDKPFLCEMVFVVRDLMQDAYPELKESADRVSKALLSEETRFAHTLDIGFRTLQQDLERSLDNYRLHTAAMASVSEQGKRDLTNEELERAEAYLQSGPVYKGRDAFKLYDTFGMPLDFIQDAARDQGIALDQAGFLRPCDGGAAGTRPRLLERRGRSRRRIRRYQQLPKSEFEGYRQTRSNNCEVLAIIKDGQGVQELKPGDSGDVILDHTPFYAESGGQVGDRGWLYSDDHNTIVAEVTGCYYPVQGVRAHQVW